MQNFSRRFIVANLLGLSVTGIVFTWIARSGTFDFWVAQHFFDPVTRTFPLEHHRALFFWGHTVLKKISVVVWLVCIGLALASMRVRALQPWRQALLTFIVMGGLASWLVQSLKGASPHSCPYDLVVYGGSDFWFPLFDAVTTVVHKGKCWPGGHASAGFVLIAGYFALREKAPAWARRVLVFSLALGTVMSAVQVVRGAHFVSHNLWSLWLVWATCMALHLAAAGYRRLRGRESVVRDVPVTAEAAPEYRT